MTENIALESDTSILQRTLEAFEHELERLHGRIFDPDARSAVLSLRDSWHRVVEIAFGPVCRMRGCPSCRRSQLQTGPRCVFCWQRFKTHDMADGDGGRRHA
jgi:hypothetical protein